VQDRRRRRADRRRSGLIADYNGVAGVSHVRDKLVEMTHLNETIYGAGIASSSHESRPTPAGNYQNDELLANVCKHNVTRFPYELARLAQDLAGGLVATLPSEQDFAGYLTESMHGAGSPQAQRIQIARQMQIEDKKRLARALAGIVDPSDRS
jgi:4-hydroxybutyryl-CoA dehydratase/vinylacetyl-CoA-Delta-isomerase